VAGVANEAPGRSDDFYAGDVIYSVNGAKVASLADLESVLGSPKRGEVVAVQIERQGQLQYLVVEVQ
jgi:S1-C subfamily serine protease